MAEPDYRGRAAAGVTALQRWYRPRTGLWAGTGWWNSASALTAVIRYTQLTGDGSHADVIATTFAAVQRQHARFVNTYHDNAWWALAWIAAFDLTRNSRYLEAARVIFARNTAAWDDSCGGGLRWHAGSTYKNAITNALFVTLAAMLHQRSPGGGYLTQGEAIAAAAIRGLAPGGILAEPCESGAVCNEDQAPVRSGHPRPAEFRAGSSYRRGRPGPVALNLPLFRPSCGVDAAFMQLARNAAGLAWCREAPHGP